MIPTRPTAWHTHTDIITRPTALHTHTGILTPENDHSMSCTVLSSLCGLRAREQSPCVQCRSKYPESLITIKHMILKKIWHRTNRTPLSLPASSVLDIACQLHFLSSPQKPISFPVPAVAIDALAAVLMGQGEQVAEWMGRACRRRPLIALSCLLLLRLFNALLISTYFCPDEYYQSVEVAHRLVYGYGDLTWEVSIERVCRLTDVDLSRGLMQVIRVHTMLTPLYIIVEGGAAVATAGTPVHPPLHGPAYLEDGLPGRSGVRSPRHPGKVRHSHPRDTTPFRCHMRDLSSYLSH